MDIPRHGVDPMLLAQMISGKYKINVTEEQIILALPAGFWYARPDGIGGWIFRVNFC